MEIKMLSNMLKKDKIMTKEGKIRKPSTSAISTKLFSKKKGHSKKKGRGKIKGNKSLKNTSSAKHGRGKGNKLGRNAALPNEDLVDVWSSFSNKGTRRCNGCPDFSPSVQAKIGKYL